MQITNFLKHHYRHFNAAALIDAAEGYNKHLADGGDSDCRLVLTLRENKADPTVSTVSGGGLWVRDVTTTTTTISWPSDNATIEKEAVVSKS